MESAYCSVNAVLRDYARLGLLLAHDGRLGGRQIIPRPWVHAATTVPAESWHLKPYAATRYFGYGYQTWIFPGERRVFALLGVRPVSQDAPTKRPTLTLRHNLPSWDARARSRRCRIPDGLAEPIDLASLVGSAPRHPICT